MRHSILLHAVVPLIDSVSTLASNEALVTLHNTPPGNAQPLVPTHLSFSIEQDRWPDWTGIDARNQFTFNALTNLQHLTGQPPKIRVGANSEDHTVWSPTITIIEESFPPSSSITPFPEATSIAVGDGFYQLSKWLPSGTHMVWGVNLGLDSVSNAVNMTMSIMKAFGTSAVKAAGVHLDLIEVGNEADAYKGNGMRPSNWTVADYVADWINVAGPVLQAGGLKTGGVTFQGCAFAGQGFTPSQTFDEGMLTSTPGRLITQISQHRYSGAFCSGGDFALSSFMNKATVRSNITVFNADIAKTKRKGLSYVLGETNSIACHGAPGVSNTAGAALWTIDYTLQAATLGVTEVYFHEGIGYKYNFIQPVSLNRSTLDGTPIDPPQPPHVQPSYYAAILVAHAVGTTGCARIVEIKVPLDNVSGYAVYESGRLVRAVFVNLDAWLASDTGTRPSIRLRFGGMTARSAKMRRLTIQHADDVSGLTFGGQSYETPDVTANRNEDLQMIHVADGVDIASTEAILLSFQ